MAKEYIEREALRQDIRKMPRTVRPELVLHSTVQKVIANAPAADVVEVVRCKNCEHLTKKGICEKFRQRYPFYPEADFHCGFGKKKEGAE